MAQRKINFNPGPAALPLEVLQIAKDELLDFKGTGMSILETSHRAKEFEEVLDTAKKLFHEVMDIPQDYTVLFLASGASLQFTMIPMNFLPQGKSADYVISGHWAKNAYKEAKLLGKANVAATTESENFTRLPKLSEIKLDPDSVYVHTTSNNTIFGTQWKTFPETHGKLHFCDMSSDILSRQIDIRKFDMIYGGAQKNLGPAGTTVVILKKSLLENVNPNLPTMLAYKTYVDNNSLFNTPAVFAIYLVKLVLDWVKKSGGLSTVQKWNEEKGRLLYDAIDHSDGFYRGTVTEKADRSLMNVTLRLRTEDLEKEFISTAGKSGFHGLKGHRSVGGVRVSMYNAITVAEIAKLVDFMKDFSKKHV